MRLIGWALQHTMLWVARRRVMRHLLADDAVVR